MGALPTLRAAVDPDVRGGEYYGPGGWFEMRGFPKRVQSSARSHDVTLQRELWERSELLTGVTYRFIEVAARPPDVTERPAIPER
jgi:hypothetical protein